MFSPSPTDEPVKFLRGIFWDLARIKLAASGHHLLGGKPDTQVPQLNEPGAIGPPHQTELVGGEEQKSSDWLTRLHFRIWRGHVASHWLSTDGNQASVIPVRAALWDRHLL